VLTRADHAARMDRRIGAKDFGAAMRAAKRLGGNEVAIVKACTAAEANSTKAGVLLDAVPSEARRDLGYVLCAFIGYCGATMSRDAGQPGARGAARGSAAPGSAASGHRRMVARTSRAGPEAPRSRQAERPPIGSCTRPASPTNSYYRAEFHFMAGWIALRFLADPATAIDHLARVDEGSSDPIVRARAAYWRGRAAEAAGQFDEMRAQYEASARNPTAYYGQLARARLGLKEVALRHPPAEPVQDLSRELLHAADILYAIGERDLVVSFVSDLAEQGSDAAALAALGQLTAHYNDAQAMLLVGRRRSRAAWQWTCTPFPTSACRPIARSVPRLIAASPIRSCAQRAPSTSATKSPANAVGLMQVDAASWTRYRQAVWRRLRLEAARVRPGPITCRWAQPRLPPCSRTTAAPTVMTFAGYNAGRGRVQQWVAQHGDPRDPKVDAVDWVEQHPDRRDAELRPARHGEPAGLSRALRRQHREPLSPTCTAP